MWCGFVAASETVDNPHWSSLMHTLIESRRATRLQTDAGELWVAADRLPLFVAVIDSLKLDPVVAEPIPYVDEIVSREMALLEIIRVRLHLLGPVNA